MLDIKDVDVPDEALLRCFVKANKPFLSKSAAAERSDLSPEGTRNRLNSLVDRGVLLSDDAGKQTKVYWLNNPRSRWPVPSDLTISDSELGPDVVGTVRSLNRLTTLTLISVGTLLGIAVLDWLSDRSITDGIFEVTLNWKVISMLAFVLVGVVFYVALKTSLHVENDYAGWPTIRRLYRQLAG